MMFDTETDRNSDNLAALKVSSIDSLSMVINLEIIRSLIVSEEEKLDQLQIEIKFLNYKDVFGENLSDNVFKIESMPP